MTLIVEKRSINWPIIDIEVVQNSCEYIDWQVCFINVDLRAPSSSLPPFLSCFLPPVCLLHVGPLCDALRSRTPRRAATSQISAWNEKDAWKENKLTRAHQTFTKGTERTTHWAQLCPRQNQINKVKIKRKKGTEHDCSLIKRTIRQS